MACYALLLLTTLLGLNPVVATLVVLPIAFLFGFGLQRFLLQRVVGENVLLVILVTFALSIIIENGLLEGFGADPQKISGGWIETATIALGHDINVGLFQVITFDCRRSFGRRARPLALPHRHRRQDSRGIRRVAAANLIGLSSVRIYAVAMGISFVTIGIAAGFMSIWTNFDPASGPTRLLIAFEVIVLGRARQPVGLARRRHRSRRRPGDRRPIRHRLADHGRPHRVPHRAGAAAARPVSEILTMDSTPQLDAQLRRAAFAAAVVAMAAAPFLFGATHVVLLTEFMSMLVLAIMWNLLAGYADIVTVGQHAFVGVGAYAFFAFAALWGLNPYLSIPLAGSSR